MTFRTRYTPCSDCHGTGKVLTIGRVSGEAFDADWIEERCDYCDGEGELPAHCAGCDREQTLDEDGLCADCSEPLTETRGDPFYGRAA